MTEQPKEEQKKKDPKADYLKNAKGNIYWLSWRMRQSQEDEIPDEKKDDQGWVLTPWKYWLTGQNLDEDPSQSFCALIKADSEKAAFEEVSRLFPGMEQRFCRQEAWDYSYEKLAEGGRFT